MIHGYALLQGGTGSGDIGISLSASHADIGDQITITGTDFGESRGTSTVEFGEPRNAQGWSPVTREAASYVSWSDTEIVVTVPSMSPGKSGETGTYHNVRVYTGGEASDAANFYVDPVSVNPAISVAGQVNSGGSSASITRTANDSDGYDYETDAILGVHHMSNMSDVLFENCTFTATCQTINGQNGGVVTLGNYELSHQRITYLNCTFASNWSASEDSGTNGVKTVSGWNDKDRVDDISFVGCNFGTPDSEQGFSRMGIEETHGSHAYTHRIALIDCVFEPCGEEPISFNDGDLYHLVSGCELRGYGNKSGAWWPYGLESNRGRYIEVRDTDIWAGRGAALNINTSGAGVDQHLLFERVDFDMTHTYQDMGVDSGSAMLAAANLSYARFKDCSFNTGTAASCLRWFVAADTWGTNPPHAWNTCTYNDFSGSTITGYVSEGFWPNPSGIPATVAGYLDTGADQTNTWPEKG